MERAVIWLRRPPWGPVDRKCQKCGPGQNSAGVRDSSALPQDSSSTHGSETNWADKWIAHRLGHDASRKVNGPSRELEDRVGMVMQALFKTPIRGEHVHGVATLRQTLRQSAHFYGRAAELQKRSVGFGDVQDSHCSRRIFFSALAKTLKRNSCSTR